MSDAFRDKILVLVGDLFFATEIEHTARALGFTVRTLRPGERAAGDLAAAAHPLYVIVNLATPGITWAQVEALAGAGTGIYALVPIRIVRAARRRWPPAAAKRQQRQIRGRYAGHIPALGRRERPGRVAGPSCRAARGQRTSAGGN